MTRLRFKLIKYNHFRRQIHSPNADSRGGSIISLIFALVFLVLIGLGINWIIKNMGQAGEQYTQTMIDTKHSAESVQCQMNMRAIYQNIQMYALSNEGFPSSEQELVKWSGSTKLFKCSAEGGGKYVYISGQNRNMSPSNVLLYESESVHKGRCSVLRLGGQIELLTTEELQQALAQTKASIR